MDALVSILIAVYNTEPYLRKCLDSVLTQTYNNIEIIIVDDGSTDNSLAICKEYEKKDSRVKVIHQENGGLAVARNTGIINSIGQYLCYLDSDDYIEPDYVEILLREMVAEDADVVVCGYYKEISTTKNVTMVYECEGLIERKKAFIAMYTDNGFGAYSWNKMFKADLIKKEKIFFDPELRMTQDLLWATMYFAKMDKCVYVGRPLYHYLFNESSACRNIKKTGKFNEKFLTSLLAHEKTKELLAQEDKEIKKAFTGRYVNTYMRLILNLYYAGYPNKELLEKAHEKIKRNIGVYLAIPAYSLKQRMGAILAAINPKLFALVYNYINKDGNIEG